MPATSAKVVVCFIDDRRVQALLPASFTLNLDRLVELAGGADIRLEREDVPFVFPEGEPGGRTSTVVPSWGQLVFVDVALAVEPELTFDAGEEKEAVSVRWADFARSIRPIVGRFGLPPRPPIGAFKLSYRE